MKNRLLLLMAGTLAGGAVLATTRPDPTTTPTRSKAGAAPEDLTGLAVATFAGGCFWSFEETFEELRGVRAAVSGYAGGREPNPTYGQVAGEQTSHAESVQVYYDPRRISYAQLLQVFLLGAHDPTTLNRQGPDAGTQYRSVAFYRTPEEKQLIEAAIKQVNASGHYRQPVVTQVAAHTRFWPAEDYHQGYYRLHLNDNPYLAHVSAPKVAKFRKAFPQLLMPAGAL